MGASEPEVPGTDDEQPLPFYTATGGIDGRVRVQAGWAVGDEAQEPLQVDAVVPLEQAVQQVGIAVDWYLNRWNEIFQVEQAEYAAAAEAEAEAGGFEETEE